MKKSVKVFLGLCVTSMVVGVGQSASAAWGDPSVSQYGSINYNGVGYANPPAYNPAFEPSAPVNSTTTLEEIKKVTLHPNNPQQYIQFMFNPRQVQVDTDEVTYTKNEVEDSLYTVVIQNTSTMEPLKFTIGNVEGEVKRGQTYTLRDQRFMDNVIIGLYKKPRKERNCLGTTVKFLGQGTLTIYKQS